MAELSLTMALAHYDQHVPFLDGAVTVDGVALTVLDVGQGPHSPTRARRRSPCRHRSVGNRGGGAEIICMPEAPVYREAIVPLAAIEAFLKQLGKP
jgi:hypothetical protein